MDVIVHSAGGALGLEPMAEANEGAWRDMYETNVLGVERVTKALLPALERGGDGHVVVVGSIAGVEVYPAAPAIRPRSTPSTRSAGPFGWNCSASRSGSPRCRRGWLRPSSRWSGSRATNSGRPEVYRGIEALSAEDVADVIAFVITRPPNVNLDYVAVKPVNQATATDVHRIPAEGSSSIRSIVCGSTGLSPGRSASLDCVDRVHPVGHLAEDGVLAVEPVGGLGNRDDEELRAVGVGPALAMASAPRTTLCR